MVGGGEDWHYEPGMGCEARLCRMWWIVWGGLSVACWAYRA